MGGATAISSESAVTRARPRNCKGSSSFLTLDTATKMPSKNIMEEEDNGGKRIQQLRPSIFPNLPPFINFIAMKDKYSTKIIKLDIPWNLWTPCNNPLLLHTFIRAGFARKEVMFQAATGHLQS